MLLWLIRKGKFDFCFHEQSLLVLVPIPCRWASGSVCDIQYAGVCFWTQQSFVWQSAWWIAEITHSGFRMFVAKPFLWRLFFFLWFLSGGFFFLPYFSKYQCENRQCEPLTVLRACLPAQLILWANLNAGFMTQQCSMLWHAGLETVPAAGTKCLSLNRCRFCLGEWKRSCGNQTLPGFPDAQQNLDPSVVPPAGLYQ